MDLSLLLIGKLLKKTCFTKTTNGHRNRAVKHYLTTRQSIPGYGGFLKKMHNFIGTPIGSIKRPGVSVPPSPPTYLSLQHNAKPCTAHLYINIYLPLLDRVKMCWAAIYCHVLTLKKSAIPYKSHNFFWHFRFLEQCNLINKNLSKHL